MHDELRSMLEFAQGPLLRFALALLILGSLRSVILGFADIMAARLRGADSGWFRTQVLRRIAWHLFPMQIVRSVRGSEGVFWDTYHAAYCLISLLFRTCVIMVPIFMVAHVYLWEQTLGVRWPALPTRIADGSSILTLLTGVATFLGGIYSPFLRRIDPPMSFAKPVLLMIPFVTGLFAMHPTWSPVDYHVVMLIHVVSAALVMAMIPFARLLTVVHTPMHRVLPELAWEPRAAEPLDDRIEAAAVCPTKPASAPHSRADDAKAVCV